MRGVNKIWRQNFNKSASDGPAALTFAMPIQSIAEESIKKLCAGQVITSLSNAVKELVENSLDAAARNIEICFRSWGSESFSVSDDGHGIAECDLPQIGI